MLLRAYLYYMRTLINSNVVYEICTLYLRHNQNFILVISILLRLSQGFADDKSRLGIALMCAF